MFMEKATRAELKNLHTKLDGLVKFLHKEMPARQEVFNLLEEKADKSDVNKILTSIDSLAKQVTVYHQEMLVITRRIDRIEAWMKKVEAKVGIKADW